MLDNTLTFAKFRGWVDESSENGKMAFYKIWKLNNEKIPSFKHRDTFKNRHLCLSLIAYAMQIYLISYFKDPSE